MFTQIFTYTDVKCIREKLDACRQFRNTKLEIVLPIHQFNNYNKLKFELLANVHLFSIDCR